MSGDEPAPGDDGAAIERSRLRWFCRRGMKELDELLVRYLDRRHPHAGVAERRAFARLLECQDPDLYALLTGRSEAKDAEIADVIRWIRHDAGL